MMKIEQIVNLFQVEGKLVSFIQNKKGHINKTYICTTLDNSGTEHLYTLQGINQSVFKDVDGVMVNISIITEFIRNNCDEPLKLVIVKSLRNENFIIDEDGKAWRMYKFIADVVCKDVVSNEREAFLLGVAFACFQKKLAFIDVSKLNITIPDFHNAEFRYKQFEDAMSNAKALFPERLENVEDEISFFEERRTEAITFFHEVCQKTPVRVTHNDAKLNNVLFSKDFTKSCVIDLDTVMPGSVLYDTGDMIRTATNTACEDEKDISKVGFNSDYYLSLKKGYFSVADPFLTDIEKDNFLESGKYITHIIGLRFLNDYLMGDIYFHTEYLEHNLVRSRTQIALEKEIERYIQCNN